MKSTISAISFVLISIVLSSCDNSRVFEEFKKIGDKGWHQDTVLTFNFEITDAAKDYNLSIDVRNTSNYKYCNLYFRYFLYDEQGNKLKTEMPEVYLMDPKSGKPLGSGISGTFTHSFVFLKNYRFPKTGKYKINMKQYMRETKLEEISNIGYRLEKVKAEK
jgi:gliding motility-associated lipoprotein GldH